jgi:hypothetical protein
MDGRWSRVTGRETEVLDCLRDWEYNVVNYKHLAKFRPSFYYSSFSILPVSKLFLFHLGVIALILPALVSADPVETAIRSKSPFKDFTMSQVADGQVLESREGSSLSPQIEAVQTCFVIKAVPKIVAGRMLGWNPAGKPGLDVSKHQTLTSSAGAETFSKTLSPLFASSDDGTAWIAAQSKKATAASCELILTPEEKKQLAAASTPAKLASAWSALMAARFASFREHGSADFSRLLSSVEKLGAGPIPAPSGGAVYYWEVGKLSDRGKLSEGLTWTSPTSPERVFDGEFFVTSEYTASLNVSTLWPVTVAGKAATLVWRIDAAFASQFTDQSGAERIASSGLMLASTKKTIEALQQGKK